MKNNETIMEGPYMRVVRTDIEGNITAFNIDGKVIVNDTINDWIIVDANDNVIAVFNKFGTDTLYIKEDND